MIRIFDGEGGGSFASELDKWIFYYNEDPWYAASEMPQILLQFFSDASEFRISRQLINRFFLYAGSREKDKFFFVLGNFSPDLARRLKDLFSEYERLGANYSTASGHHILPSSGKGLLMPHPISIEFELDNDHRFDIRTFPTRDMLALVAYINVLRKMLCELDYEEYLPLGYEMNAHLNIGVKVGPKNNWIFDDAESVYLDDYELVFARDEYSGDDCQCCLEYVAGEREQDLEENAIEEILADIRQEEMLQEHEMLREEFQDSVSYEPGQYERLNSVAQSICCLLLMPNISQARLERLRETFGMFSEDSCVLAGFSVHLGYSFRAHITYAEISPTLDVPYLVFSLGKVSALLNDMNIGVARSLLRRLIQIYYSHVMKKEPRYSIVEGFIDGYCDRALNLKWLPYHDMTRRLRREITRIFLRNARKKREGVGWKQE